MNSKPNQYKFSKLDFRCVINDPICTDATGIYIEGRNKSYERIPKGFFAEFAFKNQFNAKNKNRGLKHYEIKICTKNVF